MAFESASMKPVEAVVGTLDGQPLRAAFPMRVDVFGVAAVVIPAREYDDLRAETSRMAAPTRFQRKPKSPIDNDPEVAEFLAGSRTTLFITEAVTECGRRFGAARTPSRSAVDRFWRRLEGRLQSRRDRPRAPSPTREFRANPG